MSLAAHETGSTYSGTITPGNNIYRFGGGTGTLTVNDNGPGIVPALRETVFRPFFTSKRSGTGLGLALVQKIIVFHNGRITIGTSPTGGASLQITLPTTL